LIRDAGGSSSDLDEEGPSDLSMEGTVWDDGTNITVKVNTVHVM
jgi:hypothetical protein